MKLNALKLTNFRGYYKEQSIIFSTDTSKNVTVINGNNGEGKTSLLMALLWCLYGEEDYTTQDLINKRALTESRKGDIIESSVELTFGHEGERYNVARKMTARKLDSEKWELVDSSSLVMFKIKANGNFEKIANPQGQIESILPRNVSPYFFFDAEKIDEFAKPDQDNEVRDSMRNVLKIEILERARTHLRAAAKEFAYDLSKGATSEQQSLIEQLKIAEEQLESERKNLQNNKGEQSAGQKTLEDLSDRIGQLGDARIVEEKRKQIKGVLQAKEESVARYPLALGNNS